MPEHGSLLAVDLGLKTGLALFNPDNRLAWYRSHNYGSGVRLKRGVPGILDAIPDLATGIIEGGGNLAVIWEREAERRGITLVRIGAESWRQPLLYPREQRSGLDAKKHAGVLARRVIAWSQLPRPTALRHDAAEAIMTGLWGLLHLGRLDVLPRELQR